MPCVTFRSDGKCISLFRLGRVGICVVDSTLYI